MSDALVPDIARPPPSSAVRVPATRAGKIIRGPLKVSLDLLVYGDDDGNRYDWKTACDKAGYSRVSMRKALERAHVLAYLNQQKQVFRKHAAAGNIARAIELREQDDNKTAAIQAIRYLDGLGEQDHQREGSTAIVPGVVVQVNVSQGARVVDETVISVGPGSVSDAQSDGEEG